MIPPSETLSLSRQAFYAAHGRQGHKPTFRRSLPRARNPTELRGGCCLCSPSCLRTSHQPLGCLAPNRLVALKESLAPYPIPKRGVLLLKPLWVATGGHLAGPRPLLLDFHQVHPRGLLLSLQVGLNFRGQPLPR